MKEPNPGHQFSIFLNPFPVFPAKFVNVCMDVKVFRSMISESGSQAQIIDERVLGLVETDIMYNVRHNVAICSRDVVESGEIHALFIDQLAALKRSECRMNRSLPYY